MDEYAEETHLATRNAFKLGGSLLITWGVALAMRFLLPRYLGPERFGAMSFADALATTFFIALGLGMNAYVRKQVSVRPAHASDFFGGTFVLRVALSALLFGILALFMNLSGQPWAVRGLVYLFALAQFFVHTNATLAALLHAKGSVGGMSVLAVVTKILWVVGVGVAIVTGAGLWGFALAFLVSEVIKSVALFALAVRDMSLVVRVDPRATWAVVFSSLPYYLNDFATTTYGKLDVALLALLGGRSEAGWYAAATAIAGLTMLAMPLIEWVLMPALARAAARSHDELFSRLRRSMGLILGVAIPAALFIFLSADLCVTLIFGAAFAPAALALRILAVTFVVTHVALLYALSLLMIDRPWTLTGISVVGLAVNVGFNVLLIPPSLRFFGDGGGGAGCAFAMLGTEIFVTGVMIATVGRRAFDRQNLGLIAKSLLACALTVLVDRLTTRLGWTRLVLDGAVYTATIIATGVLHPREVVDLVRRGIRARESRVDLGIDAS
jgi:O-antigen/teichoic acid export membrane protein